MEISARARLLVIDDNEIKRRGVARVLRAADYEIVEAATGADGLRLAQETMPDLILLDRLLPDIDGVEVCRQLKAGAHTSNLFVVFLSASQTSSDSQAAGLEGGADGYVVYPIGNRELVARVEAMLRIKRAEDRLHDSEERLRTVADFTYDWEYWVGLDGRHLYVSPSCERITGYGADEFMQDPDLLRAIVHPEDRAVLDRHLLERFEGDEGAALDFRILTRGGEERWVNHVCRPVYGAGGRWLGRRASNRNITERKQAEQALTASEEKYRNLFENASIGIFHSTPEGRFLRANQALASMFGYESPDELVASIEDGARQIYVDSPRRSEIVGAVLRQDGWLRAENRYRRKDGGILVGQLAARKVLNADGTLAYLEGFVEDITERVRAGDEIRGLSRFPSENPNPVLRLGRDGTILYANEASVPLLAAWQSSAGQAAPQALQTVVAGAFESGTAAEIELTAGGLVFEIMVAPVSDEGYANLYGRDITERVRAESQREAALEALQESEDKYKYVFDNSVIGKSITLPSGEIHVNKAFCEMLGYSLEELQSRKWQAVTHPDDVELSQRALDPLLAGEKDAVRFIKRYSHKDGSAVWADVSTSLRRDKAGKPVYFMTTVIDITEQREAEEALKESEERFSTAFLTSPVAQSIIARGSNKIMAVNDAWCRLFAYRREELIGANTAKLNLWENPADRLAALEELQRTDHLLAREATVRIKSGEIRTVVVAMEPILLRGLACLISSLFDITERKQAEAALQESEARYRALFENAQVGIYRTTPDGQILAANPALVEMLGFSSFEELAARNLEQAGFAPDYPRSRFKELVERAGEVRGLDSLWTKLGGSTVYVRENARAIRGADGTVAYYEGTVEDVTEQVRAKQALQRYSQQLEEMVTERTRELYAAQERLVRQEKLAVLGQLAGGVGHELRNPLGAIKNAAFFLNMAVAQPDPEVKETLEALDQEVAAAEQIISSLLDFARPRAPVPRPADVNAVVRAALARTALPEGIDVVADMDEALPAVQADPDQLGLVFGNLLRNAVQAMPGGGRLSVTTRLAPPPPSSSPPLSGEGSGVRSRWVAVSIVDTGTGISEEDLPKLFEPLFSTKAQGIGLGLAVSKLLVTAHGGTVEVQSQIGRGSTFTVKLLVEQEKVR